MKKIFVITKETQVMEALYELLHMEYEVFRIYNVRQGMESINRDSLIIIDMISVKQKGIKLIKMIREDGIDIPIIFITQVDNIEIQEECIEAGADDYIAKPFNANIIKKRIKAQSDLYSYQNAQQEEKCLPLQQEEKVKQLKEHIIQISMLGQFKISIGNKCISASMNRSKKMWQMLQYLILFRSRKITSQEMIDVLWPDEMIEKPGYALKTLSYRVRKSLELLEVPYAKELLQVVEGGYEWNEEYICDVDAEIFEEMCRQAAETRLTADKKISIYKHALKLYKGDLLGYTEIEPWAVPIQTYYHNIWVKAVCSLLEILKEQKKYDEISEITTQCLKVDKLNEMIQYFFMEAMIKTDKKKEAAEYYQYLNQLFLSELGMKPDGRLTSLYFSSLKGREEVPLGLEMIETNMKEEVKEGRPYYCSYEVFTSLYQLERRRLLRCKQEDYIVLVSLKVPETDISLDKEINEKMKELRKAMMKNLRAGDSMTRYSLFQYILLLQNLSEQQCIKVMHRVLGRLEIQLQQEIEYKLQKVLPNTQLLEL